MGETIQVLLQVWLLIRFASQIVQPSKPPFTLLRATYLKQKNT